LSHQYISQFLFSSTTTTSTHIYTLSLHDALPICRAIVRVQLYGARLLHDCRHEQCRESHGRPGWPGDHAGNTRNGRVGHLRVCRSEEHTSELQSRGHLVCRLLLEKKKKVA